MGLEPPLPSSTQRLVRCDNCEALLYRTERMSVVFVEGEDRIQPIVVVVANRRFLFCTRSCMVSHLYTLPIAELQSGWPIL